MTWYPYRAGANPSHSARIGVISNETGSWDIECAGQRQTVSIADAADDKGVAWAEFTGLPAGDHTATITGLGRSESVAVRISAGPHKTVFGSCFSTYSWWDIAAGAMASERPHQVCHLGDAPYVDNLRQVTLADPPTNARREVVIRAENRKFKTHPSRLRLLADAAIFGCVSDHDATPGNDAPGRDDIGAFPGEDAANWWHYNGGYSKIITATGAEGEAEWRDLIDRGFAAFDLYNPFFANPDAGTVYPAGTIPAMTPYFRWTVGRVEYFQLEMVRYSDYMTQAAGVTNRSLMGLLEKQWLLDRVSKSTADFRVIFAPQQVLKESAIAAIGRNDYGRACYGDERDEVVAGLRAKPGTVVVSGDVHSPSVMRHESGGNVLWQVTPCPTGTDGVTLGAENSPDTQLRWRERHQVGSVVPRRYYGVVDDSGTGPLYIAIKSHTGGVCWAGYLGSDSNEIHYRRPKI